MTGWYSIAPTGPVAIGNLTPVGQNSGQVGCRWPPNGHQLAACLNLPSDCQLWGPFWHRRRSLYVVLPVPVYGLESTEEMQPKNFRLQWREGQWQVRPEHEDKQIEIVGGRYLIPGSYLIQLWKKGELENNNNVLQPLPWKTLTLSHNSREDFQVKDEGGFFAEMTTLMNPGWSILVKVIGEYDPDKRLPSPGWSCLGAGATPVMVKSEQLLKTDWLEEDCADATGAVLLTGALWRSQKNSNVSVPYPPIPLKAYAADEAVPWQSWTTVKNKDANKIDADKADKPDGDKPDGDKPDGSEKTIQRRRVLTPGEWMTPAGAVYLWDEMGGETGGETGQVPKKSGPMPDKFHRHVLGYGHLWLFKDSL